MTIDQAYKPQIGDKLVCGTGSVATVIGWDELHDTLYVRFDNSIKDSRYNVRQYAGSRWRLWNFPPPEVPALPEQIFFVFRVFITRESESAKIPRFRLHTVASQPNQVRKYLRLGHYRVAVAQYAGFHSVEWVTPENIDNFYEEDDDDDC